jgi:hypothetical protein
LGGESYGSSQDCKGASLDKVPSGYDFFHGSITLKRIYCQAVIRVKEGRIPAIDKLRSISLYYQYKKVSICPIN